VPGLFNAAVASALHTKSTVPTHVSYATGITVACTDTQSYLVNDIYITYAEYGDVTDYESYIPPVYARMSLYYKSRDCPGYIYERLTRLLLVTLPGDVIYQAKSDSYQYPYLYGNDCCLPVQTTPNIVIPVGDFMFDPDGMPNRISVRFPITDINGNNTFTASFGYMTAQDPSKKYKDGRYNWYYKLGVEKKSASDPYFVAFYIITDPSGIIQTGYKYIQITPDKVKDAYSYGDYITIRDLSITFTNNSATTPMYVIVHAIVVTANGTNWTDPNNVLMGIIFTDTTPTFKVDPLSSITPIRLLAVWPSGTTYL